MDSLLEKLERAGEFAMVETITAQTDPDTIYKYLHQLAARALSVEFDENHKSATGIGGEEADNKALLYLECLWEAMRENFGSDADSRLVAGANTAVRLYEVLQKSGGPYDKSRQFLLEAIHCAWMCGEHEPTSKGYLMIFLSFVNELICERHLQEVVKYLRRCEDACTIDKLEDALQTVSEAIETQEGMLPMGRVFSVLSISWIKKLPRERTSWLSSINRILNDAWCPAASQVMLKEAHELKELHTACQSLIKHLLPVTTTGGKWFIDKLYTMTNSGTITLLAPLRTAAADLKPIIAERLKEWQNPHPSSAVITVEISVMEGGLPRPVHKLQTRGR